MLIPLSIIAYFVGGWWLIAGMIGGRLAASIIGGILDMLHMRLTFKHTGFAFTASERSFFHAYRLLANRHGVTTDLSVTDEEASPSSWMPSYMELAITWPVVVSRFTEE